jgi:hypothetical protein
MPNRGWQQSSLQETRPGRVFWLYVVRRLNAAFIFLVGASLQAKKMKAAFNRRTPYSQKRRGLSSLTLLSPHGKVGGRRTSRDC